MNKPIVLLGLIALAASPLNGKMADVSDYRVVDRISGPDGGWDLLSVDPVAKRLYVARSNGVVAIDLPTNKVSPDIVSSSRGHDAMSIPGTTVVISTNGSANTAMLFNGVTGEVIARFPLKGCDGPTGIAYATDVRQIVSACANGVAIVSAPDGRQLANLKVGPGPDGAVYDIGRHLAFIPSGGDGTLSIIRLGTKPAVIGATTTAKGARTIALDASTGRLYLPSAKYLPAVGGARDRR
jgi:DNA-binding beta-propeller fold protein YncE